MTKSLGIQISIVLADPEDHEDNQPVHTTEVVENELLFFNDVEKLGHRFNSFIGELERAYKDGETE